MNRFLRSGISIACILVATWLALGVDARVAFADGGTVQFSERRNDRIITVFTSPTPLRLGPADVSVLVQNADSGAALTDIGIEVRAYPALHPRNGATVPATTEAATNKLLRAAQIEYTEAGPWHVEIFVQGLSKQPPIGFDVEIVEPLPSWLDLIAWIAWPFVAIGLFAIHQLLKHRRLAGKFNASRKSSAPA